MKKKLDPRITKQGIIKRGVITKCGIVLKYRSHGMYYIQTDDNGSTYEWPHHELLPLPKYTGKIRRMDLIAPIHR